jgi:hypothetical protein
MIYFLLDFQHIFVKKNKPFNMIHSDSINEKSTPSDLGIQQSFGVVKKKTINYAVPEAKKWHGGHFSAAQGIGGGP